MTLALLAVDEHSLPACLSEILRQLVLVTKEPISLHCRDVNSFGRQNHAYDTHCENQKFFRCFE